MFHWDISWTSDYNVDVRPISNLTEYFIWTEWVYSHEKDDIISEYQVLVTELRLENFEVIRDSAAILSCVYAIKARGVFYCAFPLVCL